MNIQTLQLCAVEMRDRLKTLIEKSETDDLFYRLTGVKGHMCGHWICNDESGYVGNSWDDYDYDTAEQYTACLTIINAAIKAGLDSFYGATTDEKSVVKNVLWQDLKRVSFPVALVSWLTTDSFRWHENTYMLQNTYEDLNYGLVLQYPEVILSFAAYVLYHDSTVSLVKSNELESLKDSLVAQGIDCIEEKIAQRKAAHEEFMQKIQKLRETDPNDPTLIYYEARKAVEARKKLENRQKL